jgi:tRNA-splicing endonuclease subunit Sen54
MDEEEDPLVLAKAGSISAGSILDIDIEDEAQDWSNLTKLKATKAPEHALPRRGEKDYEPDGTSVQNDQLQKSRDAMFGALDGPRGHIVKQNVRTIWISSLRKGLIKKPKGSFLQTVGVVDKEGNFWLNAEEFVYLAERGTIEPWFENKDLAMDLQSVYAQCFANEDEIDEYHVYAHLKRHGYIVSRSRNDEIERETAVSDSSSWISRLWSRLLHSRFTQSLIASLRKFNFIAYPPFHHLHFTSSRYINYSQIYNSIKLIPFTVTKSAKSHPIDITFNVWKPNPTFSKKSPPLPNFQILVRNVNKYKLPTLSEINSLFDRVETVPDVRSANANQINRLKNGKENIILGIVDYGIINFVKLARGSFGTENMWHIPNEKNFIKRARK